jgi:hypothetical protein
MNRKLGAFTCYGIEDVFDFLGENRIHQKIKELEGKPTMGQTLQHFTYHEPEYSYSSIAGVLFVFGELIEWFKDFDLISYLYQKSKSYNELNYFDGGLLPSKWEEEINMADFMINRNPENQLYYEVRKVNPYWNEYHFFYMQVFKELRKLGKSGHPVEPILEEMLTNYTANFKLISDRVKLQNSPFAKNILNNGFFTEAVKYLKQQKRLEEADKIVQLNNSAPDVWGTM